jgi:hypothetical protein
MSWENRVFSTRWRNAWTPGNTNTDVPSIKFNNSWDMSESSYWVDEISFIKLKNIQLGYAFPSALVSRLKLQKIYLYANAQNVFAIVNKDYEGYDPENYGSYDPTQNAFGPVARTYPVPRIVSFGINLNF